MNITLETVTKSYNGKIGCMCGCNGNYSNDAAVTKRRWNAAQKLIANGAEVDRGPNYLYVENGNRCYCFYND